MSSETNLQQSQFLKDEEYMFDLILVDGSSYLYRAFHALPSLTNARGMPTGAIYGVTNMLRKIQNDYSYRLLAIIFDAKGKSFRHEIYPAYKANRPIMPTDLQQQVPPLHELIKAMGLPLVMIDGVEADDVIATLATKSQQRHFKTLIITGDKDLTQLVTPSTIIIDTLNNTVLDEEGVVKKFGIRPSQMLDYLALVGDASDNIPGVSGIGPKTAVKLLTTYQTLDALVAAAPTLKGKVGENLLAGLDNLELAKKLLKLKTDVDLNFSLDALSSKTPDRSKLIEILQDLGFKKWLSELTSKTSENKILTTDESQLIYTEQALQKLVAQINQAKSLAIYLIADNPNAISAKIIGLACAFFDVDKKLINFYIPLNHPDLLTTDQLSEDIFWSYFKPIIEDQNIIKIGHNLKYFVEILASKNVRVNGDLYDLMIESYVLNPTHKHDFENLVFQQLGSQGKDFFKMLGETSELADFKSIAALALENVELSLRLHTNLWTQIATDDNLRFIFTAIEMPLIKVLAKIEETGVGIDCQLLQQQSTELAARLLNLEEKAYQLAGTMFNLNSPKQLQEILFTKLNLPIIRVTPNGQPSTAEETLQELALTYPLPQIILEYRSLSKLKSTYTDALPKQINPTTNRIHTSYNQAVTSTGRLSSTNPNLQNIPIKTAEGRKIRQAFIAPPGKKIVTADYSQIELRLMAHFSKDEALVKAFIDGVDIHTATAAEIFATPLDQVTDEQRRRAKAINFGLMYGMSAFGLAAQLNIPRDQAQRYIDIYFERYPGIKHYTEQTYLMAKHHGYVETLFGRRLFIPEINVVNKQRQKAAERVAINAPLQGTAADIIKIAMIEIDYWLRSSNLDINMVMQVHDELVFEIAEQNLTLAIERIQNIMTNAANLIVPLVVKIAVGNSWDK